MYKRLLSLVLISALFTTMETSINFTAASTDYTDDTAFIQSALDSSDDVYIPNGVYMIDTTIGLFPRSNQTITLSENAILKTIPNSSEYYRIFHLENVSDVTISGGTLVGDRSDHTGDDGEWGFGILISSNTKNITIKNMEITDFWGDGIYIGGDTTNIPTNIIIDNVIADNNRRQGLSITQGARITVKNSKFINTNGTAPESGIDIEPNPKDLVAYVNITNVETSNNNGPGIILLGELGTIHNINITSSVLDNNFTGLYLSQASNLEVRATNISNNEYVGCDITRDITKTKFYSVTISDNGQHGVSLITSEQEIGVKDIKFIKTDFLNNSQNDPTNNDGIRIDNYDGSHIIENIKFTACTFADYQVNPTQRYGITVGFSKGIYGVCADKHCEFSGNSQGDYLGLLQD